MKVSPPPLCGTEAVVSVVVHHMCIDVDGLLRCGMPDAKALEMVEEASETQKKKAHCRSLKNSLKIRGF